MYVKLQFLLKNTSKNTQEIVFNFFKKILFTVGYTNTALTHGYYEVWNQIIIIGV